MKKKPPAYLKVVHNDGLYFLILKYYNTVQFLQYKVIYTSNKDSQGWTNNCICYISWKELRDKQQQGNLSILNEEEAMLEIL